MKTKSIDVTKNSQGVAEFVRGLGRITKPIDLMLEGHVVGRLIPPGEIAEEEEASVVRRGWELVQRARKRNEGAPKRVIGRAVDAAVKRVRSRK